MDDQFRYDCEAKEFRENFIAYKDKKIALYGTGRITMTLLERVKEFCIIGLLDRDMETIGQEKYGLKIMSRAEAEEKADIIIINTAECYWSTIYNRIQDWKLPIFVRDGRRAEIFVKGEQPQTDYWEKNVLALEREMEKSEVISFDVFDTLLMRKLHNPNDVFKVVELKLKRDFGEDFTYIELRNRAITLLSEPTLDEIFEKMKELSGWDTYKIAAIKQSELMTDRKLISSRRDMIELCNKFMERKEVYFISDMFYTKEVILQLLQENGVCIKDKEKIIVSCDYKMSKKQGTLWEWYQKRVVCGRKALHIGDDICGDVEMPKSYGINTYCVWSAATMLQYSSLYKIEPRIQTIRASLYMGFIMEKIFNSPFALHASRGKVDFGSESMIGYCLLGGIVYTYIIWLLQNAKADDVEQLLFLSRDCYFLIKAYEYICKLLQISAPKAIYLEVSRRALSVPQIRKKEDIVELMNKYKYMGTIAGFLHDRFGIEVEAETGKDEFVTRTFDKNSYDKIIEVYGDKILAKAAKERQAYECYLEQLQVADRLVVVDTGHSGSIQNWLGRMLEKEVLGYYFIADLGQENIYYKNNMKACFQKQEDERGKDTSIYKKGQFIESFFTAPCGMLLYVNQRGEKVYDKEMKNQKHFRVREEMFQGILKFAEDMISFHRELGIDYATNDAVFVDEVFGIMLEEGFIITQEMKDGFYYDETTRMRGETPLWK